MVSQIGTVISNDGELNLSRLNGDPWLYETTMKKIIIFVFFFAGCNSVDKSKNEHRMNNDHNSKRRLVKANDGSVVEVFDLTLQEFQELVEKHKLRQIPDEAEGIHLFELTDSSIVSSDGGYAIKFHNLHDYQKLSGPHEGENTGSHILADKNPYGKDFPKMTGKLISGLLADLKISDLQINAHLLKQVDEKIGKTQSPVKFWMEHYLQIIAIVGESLNQEFGTSWSMKYDQSSKVWEPFIEYHGKEIQFFGYLWEDIYQTQDPNMPICSETFLTVKGIMEIQ